MDRSVNASGVGEGRWIDAAGHRTNVLVQGEGPPLVLLHGSGHGVSAHANWSGVIPALAERRMVVAPDVAGFGLTELKPDGDYDIKVWTGHVLGVLDALGIEQAVFVGNSFGGGISLAIALRHPERVTGLVLLGTPAGEFPMTDGLRAGWDYEPSPEAMARMLEVFPHDPGHITPEMVQHRYELSARPGAQEAFHRLFPRPAAGGETVVRGVPEKALRTIERPAMVLHGRDDRVIPLEIGLRLHRSIPDSELHSFGRCGHWVQIERRDDFVRLVDAFASRVEERS